jgi:ClpP class serine protease
MNRKIISEILTGRWFIQKQWAESHLPLVIALLKGNNPVSFVQRTGNEGIELPFVLDPSTMERIDSYKYDYNSDKLIPNPNIPPNSVGVIPITGPLTYYNGDCGEPGMMQRTNWLMDFMKRDNIGSIVQIIDTPGGEARASRNYVDQMQKSPKPILSYVDNMCASLGMFFSSASNETYLSNDLSEMGSVGSMMMLLDIRGALELEGLKLIEVYAPQSTDKNKDYNDALNGDTSLIENHLKILTDAFINHIKTGRPQSAANEKEWNSGKMFFAKGAINLGLADGIRPFNQVISKAAWLAKRNK